MTNDLPTTEPASLDQINAYAAQQRKEMRRKLAAAVAIAVITTGASVLSCVGQSFTYRQAKALEGIERALVEKGCTK